MAEFIATICAGLWSGGCIYLSIVQQPAAVQAGPGVAAALFRPMSLRAAPMLIALALVGAVAGIFAWFQGSGLAWLIGALFLAAMFPFTGLLIVPTNLRLLKADPAEPGLSAALLRKLGRLHALRSAIGSVAFFVFVAELVFGS